MCRSRYPVPGTCAALILAANVTLAGGFSAGTLTMASYAAQLALGAGDTLALSGGASIGAGDMVALSGTGARLSAQGMVTFGAGLGGADLALRAGAVLTAGTFATVGASYVALDATASIEVGGTAGATAGSFNVDAGGTAALNGVLTASALVVNGVLSIGTLGLGVGAISGAGTIALNGSLDLQGVAGGSQNGAGPVLDFATAGAILEIGAAGHAQAAALTLAGFVAGDDILWDGAVGATSFANGTLSLLDAGSVVGTLQVQGITKAEHFVAVPYGNEDASTEIVVAGAGDTATAPAGTKSPDSYVWNGALSGSWDQASDWTDRTTGGNPAALAPGANDSVTVDAAAGPFGAVSVLSGTGDAASLTVLGNTVLAGSFAVATLGALTAGDGGTLYLLAGDTLAVSGAAALGPFGNIDLSGAGADLTIGNALAVGSFGAGFGASTLTLTGGAALTTAGLIAYQPTDIAIDQASSLAVGGGSYGGGSFGLAAGYDAVLDGALAVATLALNGTLVVGAGTSLGLAVGAWTGAGTIDLGGTLGFAGALPGGGGGETIAFTGTAGVLALNEAAGAVVAMAPKLLGFGAGDAIGWNDTDLTGTTFSHGTLSLLTSAGTAATLVLSGQYTGDTFLSLPNPAGGQEVVVAGRGDTATAPAGTATPDSYTWQGGAVASWDVAANWADTTAGQTPASVPPGAQDAVTLGPDSDASSVISGVGDAAALSVEGSYLLFGQFDVGQLIDDGFDQLLSLDAGSTLSVAGAASIGYLDRIAVAGAGAALAVGGTLALGVAGSQFGGNSLSAAGGSRVTLGGLAVANGAMVSVDGSSSIEIGNAGSAPAGCFKIDLHTSATLSGTLTAPTLALNGTLVANGVTLDAGGATGMGTISIGTSFDAATGLAGGGNLTVAFANSAGVLVADSGALDSAEAFDPAITGFTQGDVIDWQGTTPTTSRFSNGTLTLLNGTATLASFDIGTLASGLSPLLVPVDSSDTNILAVGAGNTRTAPRGTRTPQTYTWAAGMVGSWDVAGNWYDSSEHAVATIAPGSQDSVQIGAATAFGGVPQVVTGVGNVTSLTILAPTVLDGGFTTASFALGGQIFGTMARLSPGSTLAVKGGASLGLGETLSVDGATFSTASLTGTEGTVLATNGAAVTLGAVGSFGLISVDALSSVAVGSQAGFTAGQFTLEANAADTLDGLLMAPTVMVSGVLTADDLTIAAGTLAGQGTIVIDGTLALSADNGGVLATNALLSIAFGSNGALALEPDDFSGARFAPTLSGFGDGGAIFYDGSLSGAVLQGNALVLQAVGTLTLASIAAGARLVVVSPALGPAEIVAVGIGDTASAPAGTSGADFYIWNGGYGGSWDAAASWSDVSSGQTPAAVAPGANDFVGLGSFAEGSAPPTDVVSGLGDAAGISVIGDREVVGSFGAGTLDFNNESVGLSVGAGGTLSVQGAAGIGFGDTLAVAGAGASFTESGSLDVGNFLFGDAGADFGVSSGGEATLGGLEVNGGAVVSVDALSSLGVGAAGHVGAGTLAIAAGQVVSFGGAAYGGGTLAAPTLVLNGVIAGGGLIEANALAGGGQIDIGAGDTMGLANDGGLMSGAGGVSVAFVGASGTLGISQGVLAPSGSLVPSVVGFGGGDVISWFGTLTGASYARGSGKLSLLDGTTTVAVIKLVGNYFGETFAVANGFDGTSVVSLSGGGGPGVAAPATLTAPVGAATLVKGVSVSGGGGGAYTAVLSDTLGVLTANISGKGGVGTITGSGSETMVITGSLTQLDADLRTLRFLASTAGSDSIAVSVNDGSGGVSDLAIAVSVTASDLVGVAVIEPDAPTVRAALGGTDYLTAHLGDFMAGHVWAHVS